MSRKNFYWFIIILTTILPLGIDISLKEEMRRFSTFIWSIFLIPNFLIMFMYPKWKVILGAVGFYSFLKYLAELSEGIPIDKMELIVLVCGSFVNGAILLTVGYFRIRYKNLLNEIKLLTITDTLTGLYNRRYFDLYMEKAIPLSERSSLALIMLDIDYFKKINDKYGHSCGDEVLKLLSRIIKSNVRQSDGYVRYGGEEFAIILPNTSIVIAHQLAERLRSVVEQSAFVYKGDSITFTISLGVSVNNGDSVGDLIEKADHALYKAKENGRNQVELI